MRQLLIKALAGSGVLLMGTAASAQYQPRPISAQEMQDRQEAQDQDRIFDRARTDLDRIHADASPFSPDRDRVTIAIQQVNQCQRAVTAGEYDRRVFYQTVASIQRVMDLNRLTDQSRSYLGDDLRAMNRLQARLEGY
jgi:hypothetical protein